MGENPKVFEAIYGAIDEINLRLPREQQLEKSPNTALYGMAGKLDSLGLVQLMVAVEERVVVEFGRSITLADERAMAQDRNPFTSVESLAAYIETMIGGNGHE